METIIQFYDFLVSFIKNGGYLVSWLLTPYNFGFITITPIAFLTIDGLLVFLSIAVAKWILI